MNNELFKDSTVLVIDDNPINLRVLYEYLSSVGLSVLMDDRGESAIELLKKRKVDIVLLDIMMPGIDGFETCRRLKADKDLKDIPVIFISALSDTTDKLKGFEAGAADYIVKPFRQKEVLARVNAHLTIVKQRRQLEELIATKNKFFSIIAHDIRNPLAANLLTADFLLNSIDNIEKDKLENFLRNIKISSERLQKLLENLLKWSRSQTGTIHFQPQQIDLKKLVKSIIFLLITTAGIKKIKLHSEIEQGVFVFADMDMLTTILRNLITNAIKFTEKGGEISVTSEDKGAFVEISVRDNGIGMDEDKISKLFRIDAKGISSPGTANEKGSGLGLILCKEFVEKGGGKIWAESELGKGSIFKFTMPKEKIDN